jgi:hypothetical protein
MNREQISQALERLNMNQSCLAKISGIELTKLNRYLKGYIFLEDRDLARITESLRVCVQIESGRARLSDLLPVDWKRVMQRPALEAAVFRAGAE